jgi:hypothetical protein
MLTLEEAIEKLNSIELLYIIERAYENNGYIFFDLSSGTLAEKSSNTTVKLYCGENPLDKVPNPANYYPDKENLSDEKWQELQDEIEVEREKLKDEDRWKLEEMGLDEIKMNAIRNKKRIRKDWENKIRDYYVVHEIFREQKD